MRVGTKSVLFGAHCFFLHPFFVAEAWRRLYGFPWDPRLWVAFAVHDIGYWGKPDMDGPEGEVHPEVGARIMHVLFDRPAMVWKDGEVWAARDWHDFTLCHSRYYAKKIGRPFSRLCVADKLACALTPAWLYVPMVCASGEVREYLANGRRANPEAHKDTTAAAVLRDLKRGALIEDPWLWFRSLQKYMRLWVEEHKDERPDQWTNERRAA